jgi:hypothetical protein
VAGQSYVSESMVEKGLIGFAKWIYEKYAVS